MYIFFLFEYLDLLVLNLDKYHIVVPHSPKSYRDRKGSENQEVIKKWWLAPAHIFMAPLSQLAEKVYESFIHVLLLFVGQYKKSNRTSGCIWILLDMLSPRCL